MHGHIERIHCHYIYQDALILKSLVLDDYQNHNAGKDKIDCHKDYAAKSSTAEFFYPVVSDAYFISKSKQ